MQLPAPNSKPDGVDMGEVVQHLCNLRDALVRTSLALRDYHFSLESPERQFAAQQMERLLERSRRASRSCD